MTYVEKLAKIVYECAIIIAIVYSAVTIYKLLGGSMDSTDTSAMDRSGMYLHTDHKTGLQYLSTPYGGLTPRLILDTSGNTRHMTIKDEN